MRAEVQVEPPFVLICRFSPFALNRRLAPEGAGDWKLTVWVASFTYRRSPRMMVSGTEGEIVMLSQCRVWGTPELSLAGL